MLKPSHPTSETARKPSEFRKAVSQSSKSLSSSKMSSNALQLKLRSFASMRATASLRAGIRLLCFALAGVLLFVVVISLIRYFTVSYFIDHFTLVQDTIFLAGRRRYLFVRVLIAAHCLLMSPRADTTGVFWDNFFTVDQTAHYRQSMHDDLTMIDDLSEVLYVERPMLLSHYHEMLYTETVINTYHVRDQVKLYFELPVTFWDAVLMHISQARVCMSLPLEEIVDTNPTVYYVLRNGFARGFHDTLGTLNETCFLYQDQTVNELMTLHISIFGVWDFEYCGGLCHGGAPTHLSSRSQQGERVVVVCRHSSQSSTIALKSVVICFAPPTAAMARWKKVWMTGGRDQLDRGIQGASRYRPGSASQAEGARGVAG